MSSSGAIDFGAGLEELSGIDNALKRLAKNDKKSGKGNGSPKPKYEKSDAPVVADGEGQGGENAPKPKQSAPRATAKKAPADDPWVNATYKVRDSKKKRLAKLSLERKLAELSTHTLQEMLDEGLDYVLSKYAIKK